MTASGRPRVALGPQEKRLGLLVALLLAAFTAFLVERARVGLRTPVPWPDEGSFLWQALAFRDHWTLFAPELNPTRHVLWMPPAFMVLNGLLFKVLPFSLSAARVLSAVLLCVAIGATVLGFRSSRAAFAVAVLAIAFLSTPVLSFVGNVARMETLVLAVTAIGFFLLGEGRAAGFAVLLVGPLSHPNGVFPCAAALVLLAVSGIRRFRFGRPERVAFGFVLLFWAIYAVYVLRHLPAFREDMIAQLRFKEAISLERGGPMARLASGVVLVPVLVLAGARWLDRRFPSKETEGRNPSRTTVWSCLAAGLVLQTTLATGWLYEGYVAFAFLVVSAVFLDAAANALEHGGVPRARAIAAGLALLAGALYVDMRAVRSEFVEHSLRRSTVRRDGLSPPYFTGADTRAIVNFLNRIADREGHVAVQFIPDAEALLFERLRSPRISFTQQTFYVNHFDVAIVHESVWFPSLVHDLEVLNMFSMHHTPPETHVIRSHDMTEHFVAAIWRDPPPEEP